MSVPSSKTTVIWESPYFEIERVSDALELLGQAKEKLPPTANLYAAFGQGYIERDELDQALVEIEAAIEADPEHVQAHFLKGVVLYKLSQFEEAEEILGWVAEKDPGFPGLVLQQGLLFEALGQIEKAEKYEDPEEMAAFMKMIADWNGGTCVDIRKPFLDLREDD